MSNSQLNIIVAISSDFFTAFSSIPRQKQSKIVDFINKFRNNPMSVGINYEKIKNAFDPDLRSIRIDDTYRGIVLNPKSSNVYLLLWVAHHDEAYAWAIRKKCIINAKTGNIQVFDVKEEELGEKTNDHNIPGIYDAIPDEDLIRIGVPEEILGFIRTIHSIEDLDSNINAIPDDVYEALYYLATGYSYEDVLKEFNNENKVVDTEDFSAALNNVSTLQKFMVLDDESNQQELKEMLGAPLEKWRVFLHPTQRKIVQKDVNGPYRVLGGAGTGKTVVAMHRAKWLLENILTRKEDRILFTTFTRNLAGDIKENLSKICSPEIMKRIDVVNLDLWVSEFLRKHNYNYRIIYGKELEKIWDEALTVSTGELSLNTSFYREEWQKVIVPNEITKKSEYIKVSRVGRGVKLDRKSKAQIWNVFEELKNIMNEKKVRDIDTAIMEARVILSNLGDILPYKTVLVDEAQDFGIQAFKLIRQIAGEEHKNDIFIVGDSHQRIYRNKVVLSKCGINVRGRSSKLKINYRTTEETRKWAFNLLDGIEFDDLDNGVDSNSEYKSLIHGPTPQINNFVGINDEIEYIVKKISELKEQGIDTKDICLVSRTDRQIEIYSELLKQYDIETCRLKRKELDNRKKDGIRLATMHRVKGLEFDYVFLAGINKDIVPLKNIFNDITDKTVIKERITSEKSLLYVAATRAKKAVFVSSYGEISKLIKNRHN